MFGYRLIKNEEIEVLNNKLEDAIKLINEQKDKIIEFDNKNKEYKKTIANLTKPTTVKNGSKEEKPVKTENAKNENKEENPVKTENKEEKPVKKVRRKYTKKNTKKEE
jgi:hypothetical protein